MSVESGTLPAEGVRKMFDRIAPVYDAMNHVMTAGLDRRWRRITIDETVREGPRARRMLRHRRSRDRVHALTGPKQSDSISRSGCSSARAAR